MDTYIEFCIHFWEATRELDLYSMDGSQLDRIIVDALLKTNGGKELLKTSVNELSVLIRAINYNNRKIQQPSLPDNLAEAQFNYVKSLENAPADQGEELIICEAFKAGAEWMAGQGVSTVAISSTEYGITEEGMKLIADYLESLPDKTEVVLQIRKK